MNRDLGDQEVLFMWRMFRAAILGVLIGIVGGVIFGQVSYVKKYKDKVSRGDNGGCGHVQQFTG